MRLKRQQLKEGHLYLVPRMFPVQKHELTNKYGVVYDLCLYSSLYQRNTTGKMINFMVIDSDNRDPYYPYELWQTSPIKIEYTDTKKIHRSIEMSNVYAKKIQKWYIEMKRERARQFISEMLFFHMLKPITGWLYKRSLKKWESQFNDK